ncbi:hypothetical protein [Methanoculleus sp. MH98A]|uniref:hypothetical protein n=1 Tax=Methanoculleus sp. MH98A TaxID=1495314 RepID=UPI000A4D3092|nr:hypothetical protein [Methanoculleus sp. MH98A]
MRPAGVPGTAGTGTDPVRAVQGACGTAERKRGRVVQGTSPESGVPVVSRSKIFILVYLWTPVIRE